MDIKLTIFDPINITEDHFIYVNFDNVNYYHSVEGFPEYTELLFKDGTRVVVAESCEEIFSKRH